MIAHVTDHAAERYRERFAADISIGRAKWTLVNLLRDAKRMGIPGPGGGEYVLLHETDGIVGIVQARKKMPVLVTVIPRQEIGTTVEVDPWEET
jgi:hypothetical protein